MQVILKEDVANLGKAGDVVNVRDGYGRNFLLPKKNAEELSTKLADLSLTISRDAGEEDKLFGSVTTKDIAEGLRNEGYIVDRHDIHLEGPIKQLGIFDVPVKLHPEVTGTVKVWVVKK